MVRVPQSGPRQVTARNTITLPKHVMDHLGLKAGDFVDFDLKSGSVTLKRVRWKE